MFERDIKYRILKLACEFATAASIGSGLGTLTHAISSDNEDLQRRSEEAVMRGEHWTAVKLGEDYLLEVASTSLIPFQREDQARKGVREIAEKCNVLAALPSEGNSQNMVVVLRPATTCK